MWNVSRSGPGDVPELGDNQLGIGLLEHFRQQGKCSLPNEYERGFIARLLQDGIREDAIDLAIHFPVSRPKCRGRESDMTERP